MSNFGLSCDVCNRENVGITWVNGMKFCAKCYQETFGETDKDRKIADLEAKLVEKEKEIAYMTKQAKKFNNEAQKYYEDAYCNESIYQDKISFCIEKIQETKKSLRNKVCLMGNDTHCYLQNAIHWQDVVAIIDNQIAELKKGVE